MKPIFLVVNGHWCKTIHSGKNFTMEKKHNPAKIKPRIQKKILPVGKTPDAWSVQLDIFKREVEQVILDWEKKKNGKQHDRFHGKLDMFGHRDVYRLRSNLVQKEEGKSKPVRWTFAVICKKTGNVFKPDNPKTGAMKDIKSTDVKGNLFDSNHGLGRLDKNTCSFFPKEKNKVKQIWPVLSEGDGKDILGKVFTWHNSYRAPDVYRVIGWTKSRKSVLLQAVPMIDGFSRMDVKWLDAHPATDPILDRDKSDAVAKARREEDGRWSVHFRDKYGSNDLYMTDDLNRVFSWCEY